MVSFLKQRQRTFSQFEITNMLLRAKTEDLKLSAIEKLTLVTLSAFANDQTLACYPSNAYLAEVVGCAERSIIRATKKLEELEYIRKTKWRDGVSSSMRNGYVIIPENFPAEFGRLLPEAGGNVTHI